MIFFLNLVGSFGLYLYFTQLGQQTEGCRIMERRPCIPKQNLTRHVISRHEVDSDETCSLQCYMEKWCVSYNLGPKSGVNRACVLSHSDHVIHPGDIQKGTTYDYCFYQNPCSSNPCSSGRCRPDETFTKYECVCFTDDPCYKGCDLPLGMQSGAIPNASITASSFFGSGHEPFRARLHFQGLHKKEQFLINSGSWSAKSLKAGEYLQVDLGQIKWVSMVATQGRPTFDQWVTSYTLAYSQDGVNYKMYTEFLNDDVKVFQGNSDRNTVVKHVLQSRAIQAKSFRFIVRTWKRYISMRAEIYGCPYN